MSPIETWSGLLVNISAPDPRAILLHDIAHSLSHLCRYNGHTGRFYSVAEHSLILSWFVESTTDDPKLALTALMHDATETYIGDLPRPIKKHIPEYRALEDKLYSVIAEKFGLIDPLPPEIVEYDARLVCDERAVLMSASGNIWSTDCLTPLGVLVPILGQAPGFTCASFLHRFQELSS